ncbi:hypothetical protein [Nonomuraea typhae]|uniref:hypothetical protein n=1 Tax=Nonomuraea typhae TaxID=2603600 RepID=UPI001CA4F4BC|nr:hypothetical protein [Nonomuraea typhae]
MKGNSEMITSRVGARNLPESVLTLSSLPAIDYADHFALTTGADAVPERWARAMFGDVPSPGERFIWRGLLGLRLSRGRSPATVAGWRIAGRGDDWILLETASWFLTCNLLVQTAAGKVSLGTFLHYRRLWGRIVWPPLSAVHRCLTPGVLRKAAAVISPRREPGAARARREHGPSTPEPGPSSPVRSRPRPSR